MSLTMSRLTSDMRETGLLSFNTDVWSLMYSQNQIIQLNI